MKKIYITPATDSVEVKLQTMIAGSITLNDEGGTGTLFDEDAIGDALSREIDGEWSYDEEDEWEF